MASLKKSSRDAWSGSWQAYINKLRTAIKSYNSESEFRKVLKDCLDAYKNHLLVSAKDEALAVISGNGCTCIEIAFMWMGRWRPTSAVVLVYSTMGLTPLGTVTKEFDLNVEENFATQSALNEQQLSGLSALQKHALQAETDISQQLAVLQMLLVEQNAVKSLHLGETTNGGPSDLSDLQHLMDARLADLQCLLEKADELRLHTLRVLLDLLTPIQGATCVVAAFELVFALQSLTRSIQNSGS